MALPALRPGDRVAVISPASFPPPPALDAGIAVLRDWGLQVVEAEHLRGGPLPPIGAAASDADRAADFQAAWADPDIAAIWCARGGYGVTRLLEHLDQDALATGRPKPVIGFSDATPLLHRLARDYAAPAIHGPVLTSLGDGDPRTLAATRALLFGELGCGEALLNDLDPWQRGASATGPLVGGNIALLAGSLGCGDLIPARDALIFLEDLGQPSWVLDRALVQLRRSGWFDGAAAVVLGDIDATELPEALPGMLRDFFATLGLPVWAAGSFGHGTTNLPLPIGVRAVLDGSTLRLA